MPCSPDGRLVYSRAGHNPPIVVSATALRSLAAGGPILGAFKEADFEQEEFLIQPGDVLLLYSDGVSEAHNAEEEEFGGERLVEEVRARAAAPADSIVGAVHHAVNTFSRKLEPDDDMTIIVAKLKM